MKKIFIFRITIMLLLICLCNIARGQEPSATDAVDTSEKARALLTAATKALGGSAYLNVKSERSRGYLTPYREVKEGSKDRQPDKLATQSFTDYILLPDKERVEFKNQGRKFIQANAGEQNWTYDSDAQILRDQSASQRDRFRGGLRFQLDHIMRGGWLVAGVKLAYLARQEIWLHQFAEGVRITFPDGAEASLFFDPQTSLPLALRFPAINANDEHVAGENRFFKFIEIGGINTPHVVDLYENGQQVMRINYEERSYNAPITEKIFNKPENAKSLK